MDASVKLHYWFGEEEDHAEEYWYEISYDQAREALREILLDMYIFPDSSRKALSDLIFDIDDYLIEAYKKELCDYFKDDAYDEWH